jgi:hypothetical protein
MLRIVCKPIAAALVGDDDANHWGLLGMYLSAGFQVVRDGEDGTVVVRKIIGEPASS